MRSQRLIALIIALAVVSFGAWWFIKGRQHGGGDSIIVYYTKTDGTTEVPWRVSLGPARDLKSVAFYAAAQALGCDLAAPFMTLSFLALSPIPELKLTDQGLIDAVKLQKTTLFI